MNTNLLMNVLAGVRIGYMCETTETKKSGLRLRPRHPKIEGRRQTAGSEDVTINAYDIKLVLRWFSQFIGSRWSWYQRPESPETRKKERKKNKKRVAGDFQRA